MQPAGQSGTAGCMSCLNLEIARSLSRQVSTDEAEKAGIWTRVRGIMMMYMACSTRTSENKPNSRSEQIDGWRDGRMDGRDTGLNKRPPKKKPPRKKLRSSNPGTFTISTPGRRCECGRPPPWSTRYTVQGVTTHKGRSRPGATTVQPSYNPSTTTHKAHLCCSID